MRLAVLRTCLALPAMIARAAPDVTTHAIGFVEAATEMPFDEIRTVHPADRDDSRKSLTTNQGATECILP